MAGILADQRVAHLLDGGADGFGATLDNRLPPPHETIFGRDLQKQPARWDQEQFQAVDMALVHTKTSPFRAARAAASA